MFLCRISYPKRETVHMHIHLDMYLKCAFTKLCSEWYMYLSIKFQLHKL